MISITSANSPYKGPARDCGLCPRLFEFRETYKARNPDWHNAPVPSFGALDARFLIVGLAPGLRGANLTGRPFTGDHAGGLLYSTLIKFGWARGHYDARADDDLALINCRVTNAVRCVPPQNKPTGPEVNTCKPFLADEIAAMKRLEVILALGGLAHGAVVVALGHRKSAWKFGHNRRHDIPSLPILFNSYHCSRYNTNTGRLTPRMFEDVFSAIQDHFNSELCRTTGC